MDSQSVSLVRASFKAVAAQEDGPDRLARSFYSILFAHHPDLRDLFPAVMLSQRDRLVKAIAYVVDRLDEPDKLLPFLRQLGTDHRKYGVRDVHYVAVGDSLVAALRKFAANELWTDAVDEAWTDVLDLIATTMKEGANGVSGASVWAGTVIEHERVLRNAAIIRLQLDVPIAYTAGQYMSVQIPQRPKMWRFMSPANPANDAGEIEFHIRSIAGGWVSQAMVGSTDIGDRWLFGSPLGELGLPKDPTRDMLMVASGTGIAPLRAQLMEMAQRPQNPRVHLFVCGHHPCDIYDIDVLSDIAAMNPWLTITPVSEVDDNPWWFHGSQDRTSPAMANRITGQIGKVVAALGSWADRDVQIVGPPPMVQTTKFRMMAAGTPTANFRHDPLF
ncbi:FAD-binding oxidoreductase [Antrihabitans cavernicola]|uniref:nitric oxide dioxygenase n=1 Tax=Antrihabitans cavernicola TaxID=2495913 RepID=A0A5A7S7I8_9NOCA|nr:FAD-binding oxidoreductase [Spelaeibacter cavernicola]KAA0018951.1 flavoprotein [Spelaeibacter cavernicola]